MNHDCFFSIYWSASVKSCLEILAVLATTACWRKNPPRKFSGTYISLVSGCVGKNNSVGYVELVLGCHRYFFSGAFPISEFSKKRWEEFFDEHKKIVGSGFRRKILHRQNCILKTNFKIAFSYSARISFRDPEIWNQRLRQPQKRVLCQNSIFSSTKILILY